MRVVRAEKALKEAGRDQRMSSRRSRSRPRARNRPRKTSTTKFLSEGARGAATWPQGRRLLGTFANRAWLVIAAATVVLSATIAIADEVPRRDLTPGAWRPEIDLRQVCATKWGRDQRHVTKAMKDRVYRAYGVGRTTAYCKRAGCEVDHRIPRDLGGADEVENLWPQPYAGRWNAHTKDRLEAWAKRAVCITGGLTVG
jgi:hypothetical protein